MEIYKGIQMVMDEIGAIKKNRRNDTQKFNFRGIDDVMNVLHPLLSKAHIIIIPWVNEIHREERTNSKGSTLIYTTIKAEYRFVSTDDGSGITASVYGEGMDAGDKSLNKAMSIAMKYACFQVFCIPTEEMIDPDKDSYQVAPKPAPAKPEYPPEFTTACKFVAGGSTLGKIYKSNRPLFDSILKTGTPEEIKQAQIILKYMTGGTQ